MVQHFINLRSCKQLGWTFWGSAYCQQINKAKSLARALLHLTEGSAGFRNVLFSDQTIVQLETHCCFACLKVDQPPRPKLSWYIRIGIAMGGPAL